MKLPITNISSFLEIAPFSWKVRDANKKLKMTSVMVDSRFMNRNDAIRHKATSSNRKNKYKRLLKIFPKLTIALLHTV